MEVLHVLPSPGTYLHIGGKLRVVQSINEFNTMTVRPLRWYDWLHYLWRSLLG